MEKIVFFALGLLLCGVALLLDWRQGRNFKKVQEETAKELLEQHSADLEMMVSDLVQELNRTAERIIGDLEAKTASLGDLVAKAETMARTLSVVPELSAAVALVSEEPVKEPGVPPVMDWHGKEEAIRSLSAKGVEVGEIARQLGIGKGEVALFLNLERSRNSSRDQGKKGGQDRSHKK